MENLWVGELFIVSVTYFFFQDMVVSPMLNLKLGRFIAALVVNDKKGSK